MVWLIAATVMAAQADAPLVLADAPAGVQFLRSMGFKVEQGDASDNHLISRDGVRCRAVCRVSIGKDGTQRVVQFQFSWTYAFPQSITDQVLAKLPAGEPLQWTYEARLDGCLRLESSILVDSTTTRRSAAKEIDQLCENRKKLETEFVRPRHGADYNYAKPPPDVPLDEHRIVHGVGHEDVAYLIRKWSWQNHHGYGGYGGDSWMEFGEIDDNDMFFSGPYRLEVNGKVPMLRLWTRIRIEAADPEKWVKDHQSGLGKMKLIAPHMFNKGQMFSDFIEEIDFHDGMSIADFKAKVLEFARTTRGLSAAAG